ncbi:hypothetical protein [Nonlabens xiamenensis]|uniref:hypothetical protein n=1 Tax=Nonlabens xiamenensis TaxID=2341043 RepID=UPI000F60547C|nr:hypothetical protein [Nonlabens xiamenensis]
MRKLMTALLLCLLIACKDDKYTSTIVKSENSAGKSTQTALQEDLTDQVKTNSFTTEFYCDGASILVNLPIFETTPEAKQILESDIIATILVDKEITLDDLNGSDPDMFCSELDPQLEAIELMHVNSSESWVGYDLTYTKKGIQRRLAALYQMPRLNSIAFTDLIRKDRRRDVFTILNANLQPVVASMTSEIEDSQKAEAFRTHLSTTPYQMQDKEMEDLDWTLYSKEDGTTVLRVLYDLVLPSEFNELNQTAALDIATSELKPYLDLSDLID